MAPGAAAAHAVPLTLSAWGSSGACRSSESHTISPFRLLKQTHVCLCGEGTCIFEVEVMRGRCGLQFAQWVQVYEFYVSSLSSLRILTAGPAELQSLRRLFQLLLESLLVTLL